MKQTFLVTVMVEDDCSPADVAKDIELAVATTDGEYHAEHANWEPIPMYEPKVKPVAQIKVADPKNFTDSTKYHAVLMQEVRTKLFVRTYENLEDPADIKADWWKFQHELEERARAGELHSHFDDAPSVYTGGQFGNHCNIPDIFGRKDFPNDSTRCNQIPIEEI